MKSPRLSGGRKAPVAGCGAREVLLKHLANLFLPPRVASRPARCDGLVDVMQGSAATETRENVFYQGVPRAAARCDSGEDPLGILGKLIELHGLVVEAKAEKCPTGAAREQSEDQRLTEAAKG